MMESENRQQMLTMAIDFLKSPKISNYKFSDIQSFLERKGLSINEINEAVKLSGFQNNISSVSISGPPLPVYDHISNSKLSKIRDICNIIIVIGGTAYCFHYVYKNYIGPYLTGRRKKTVNESILEVQQSVVSVLDQVQTTMGSMEYALKSHIRQIEEIREMKNCDCNNMAIVELKSEISSIKSLLLGRNAFPPAPVIPSWQIRTNEKGPEVSPGNKLKNEVDNTVKENGIDNIDKITTEKSPKENGIHDINEDESSQLNENNIQANEDIVDTKDQEIKVNGEQAPSK